MYVLIHISIFFLIKLQDSPGPPYKEYWLFKQSRTEMLEHFECYVYMMLHIITLNHLYLSFISHQIFSHERKWYNRKELARHRAHGDPDDTSHRGHPLCKFCDDRYLDNDELLKHLRRDHYFCHFCDADGSQEYYRCVYKTKHTDTMWSFSFDVYYITKIHITFYSQCCCQQ